jgi:hypothetical protein
MRPTQQRRRRVDPVPVQSSPDKPGATHKWRAIKVQRHIIVRVGGLSAKINTTTCAWCTEQGICNVCAAKAERARASLARTAAKREARRQPSAGGTVDKAT